MTESPTPGARPERRAYRRAPLDRPVLLDAVSASEPVRALDVSGGGLAIRSELTIPLGDIVEVYFELPIGVAVEARAEVVRSEPGATALRFIGLEREALVALRSFCRISGIHRLEAQPSPASR